MKHPLKILCFIGILLFNIPSIAQQKLPYSFMHKLKTAVPKHEIPLTASEKQTLTRKEKVIKKEWEQDFKELAKMEKVKNGATVWRATFEVTDAENIGLVFRKCILSDNSRLFFYNETKDFVIGPITSQNILSTRNNEMSKSLTITNFPDNKITIELYEFDNESLANSIEFLKVYATTQAYPYGLAHKLKKDIPTFEVYSKNELLEYLGNIDKNRHLLPDVDMAKDINIDLDTHGVWQELPNGDRIWRLKFSSFMAEGIGLLGKVQLPKNAKLFAYNSLGTHIVNLDKNIRNNRFYSDYVSGSACIIEYYEPAAVKGQGVLQLLHADHKILTKSVKLSELFTKSK